MAQLYLSPNTELHSEIEVKRSRFICLIREVSTSEQARAFIQSVRNAYPDARHHCNAYIVADSNIAPVMHSSDDGEPSGTAGRPMLEVLIGTRLVNVCAVVVRYFGGVLLGTGGLVRAYTQSVQECLRGAKIYTRHELLQVDVAAPLHSAGKLESDLRARGIDVVTTHYNHAGVQITCAVAELGPFQELLDALSRGTLIAHTTGRIVVPVSAGTIE